MKDSEVFLEKARLGERNPVLIAHDERPHLSHVKHRFDTYCEVDLAHVVMLVEQGIVDHERGRKLLEGLLAIQNRGVDEFQWIPEVGSCLVQFEHALSQSYGDDVAGRLQTGRSRNDQEAAVERLYLRDLILTLVEGVLDLQRKLLELAARHTETVMPGYTHFQHAQPWTFGHYLMRQAYIFERDLQRLRGAFTRNNLSALGGAAQAGTSWPLDRRRTCELLGHDGLVVNSNDAGEFARDHIEEAVASQALMMSNIGRYATDLYVWSSWEFSMVEVDDGLAGTSSIMPQKKNPHALERAKALAGQAAGWLPTVMSCQRGVLSTDLDMVYGDDLITQYASACRDSLALITEVTRTLVVHEDVMAERAAAYWSTTSHLADELVRRFDLPFRTAHHVVGALVKGAVDEGIGVSEVRGSKLDEAAQEFAGRPLGMDDDELRSLLDGHSFIYSRRTEGSVHPDQVRAQIEDMKGMIKTHVQWFEDTAQRVESARLQLSQIARVLAESA